MTGCKIEIGERVRVTYWYSGYPCGYHEGAMEEFHDIRDAYRWAKQKGVDRISLCIPDIDASLLIGDGKVKKDTEWTDGI